MTRSTRFLSALRLLSALAQSRPEPLTSAKLAAAAGGHAVVARRLLGRLSRAGLTRSKGGKDGGAVLVRGPKRISLRQVFEAVEGETLVPRPSRDKGEPIPAELERSLRRAERAFLKALDETTLRDVIADDAPPDEAA